MAYNKRHNRYRKGKATNSVSRQTSTKRSTTAGRSRKRRSSFTASMMQMLMPLLFFIGLGVYLFSNIDVEDLKTAIKESQTKERSIEQPERNITIEDEPLVNVPPTEETNDFTESDQEIFKIVEQMPRFAGCENMEGTNDEKKRCAEKKMLQFIYNNVKYPTEARENGIEELVVIGFVVNEAGDVTDPKIIRGNRDDLNAEALCVVNEMPRWTPGMHEGKTVKVQFNLPIRFELE